MTIPESDESIFEQALRADLPSAEQEARLRRRLLTAGIVAGSGLAASSAAAGTSVGLVGQLAAKVAALSWPATLVLTTAVATPIVALPVWLAPKLERRTNAPEPGAASRATAGAARLAAARSNGAAEPARAATSDGALAVEEQGPAVEEQGPAAEEQGLAAEPKALAATSSPSTRLSGKASSGEPSDSLAASAPTSTARSAAVWPAAEPDATNAPASPPNASTLRAETELLDRVFAELRAGHQARAAALITEHEQRFPNGLLRQERERARARLKTNLKGE